jgi:pSer/pThr/pTyr-binding forkhead associated (FHA) protein
MAELSLRFRSREIARVPVVRETTTIGRDPDCDVLIDNVGVSRIHATVEVRNGQCVVVDNDSENGTFVHGSRIRTHVLADGMEIQIGKHTVKFHGTSGPALPGSQRPPPSRRPQKTLWGLGGAQSAPVADKPLPRSVVKTMHMSEEQVARAMASGQGPANALPVRPAASSVRPPSARRTPILVALGCLLILGLAAAAGVVAWLVHSGRW